MSQNSGKLRVAVVGGGISALSTAFRLLDVYSDSLDLKLLAKERYDNTTTYAAAGIWFPLGNFGPEAVPKLPEIRKWFLETAAYYETLIGNGQSSERGIRPLFAVQIVEKGQEILGIQKTYEGIYPMHKVLTKEELSKMFPHVDMSSVTHGNLVQLFSSNPDQYLTWLEKSIERLGGKLCYGVTVDSLSSLKKGYDVIINATGIDAKEMARDDKMVSIKGQSTFVMAPWVTGAVYMSHVIIIPLGDGTVLLGGTYDRNNRDPHVEQPVKESIMETCMALVPSLKHATFVRDAVGLRPFRIGGPRVELEHLSGSDDVIVIHNYGHGPEGYGLHWGCSGQVLKLFTEWKQKKGENA